MNTDVIIIGGGISGCILSYFLALEGVEVTLLEMSGLNSASSGANSGSLHGQIPHETFLEKGSDWAHTFGPTLSLMNESIQLWKNIEDSLEADLEINLCGGLLVAKNKKEVKAINTKAAIEKKFGIHSEYLEKSQLQNLAPYLSEDSIGAMYYPDEGKANPLLVTPAFASKAEILGVKIFREAEVKVILERSNGFRLHTTKGSFDCKRVVNCAGKDIGKINAMVGLENKLFSVPIQSNITEPVEKLINHLIYSAGERLTLKQTHYGSCIIGGGWPSRIDKNTGRLSISFESVVSNLSAATGMVPSLESVQLVRTWPAWVNATDDWKPILGETESIKGFFVCAFPWMGFTGAPIAARILADMILGLPSRKFKN